MLHKLTEAATAGIEKTRIRATELKLGMFVSALDRPWIDSPFLVHGFTIRNNKQLAEIQQLCQIVYIDITRGSASSDSNHGAKPEQLTSYGKSKSFADNMPQAISMHGKAKTLVNDLFDDFRSGNMFQAEMVRQIVKDCVNNIVVNPDSMLWLSMIKNKDEYTAEHSLNVAILSIALGREEGLMQKDLETLGICAMLHDVGKIKVPDEILNKEGSLDAKEFEIMKMHTVHGKKLLLSKSDVPDAAVDIALSHHERLDGTGYPVGLKAAQIPYLVRIVAIADAYDAMTSGRIYSTAKPAAEALKQLIKGKDTSYDADLISKFIQCIGVYPLGSIAELNTGEVGIVLPSLHDNRLKPQILIVRDHNKAVCEQKIIDMATDKRSDNGKAYMIRALHADSTFDIHLAEFKNVGQKTPPKPISK